jgi:hypothetical protein
LSQNGKPPFGAQSLDNQVVLGNAPIKLVNFV